MPRCIGAEPIEGIKKAHGRYDRSFFIEAIYRVSLANAYFVRGELSQVNHACIEDKVLALDTK